MLSAPDSAHVNEIYDELQKKVSNSGSRKEVDVELGLEGACDQAWPSRTDKKNPLRTATA